jgi:hypothetical protein
VRVIVAEDVGSEQKELASASQDHATASGTASR